MRWITYKGKRIYAYSDTHGLHHLLPKDADIIICAGDIGLYTEQDTLDYMQELGKCSCPLILFVPGNHDLFFELEPERAKTLLPQNVYLLEGIYLYEEISFYGLSVVPWLHSEVILPHDIDILVTHGAPRGYLDESRGCPLLIEAISKQPPKIHIFGHAHRARGEYKDDSLGTLFLNVSSKELSI